jgi:hypothetical protein
MEISALISNLTKQSDLGSRSNPESFPSLPELLGVTLLACPAGSGFTFTELIRLVRIEYILERRGVVCGC